MHVAPLVLLVDKLVVIIRPRLILLWMPIEPFARVDPTVHHHVVSSATVRLKFPKATTHMNYLSVQERA